MNSVLPCQHQLIAEMKATFPGIHARPLAEFGLAGSDYGVWTGMDGLVTMGDEPIFLDACLHADGYDGGIHEGFLAWLESRGWYVENYDGATLFIIPIAFATALGES
jgi:hypothetical protein